MNKASGADRIPAEVFKILKDDTVTVLHPICQKFANLKSGYKTGKRQYSFKYQRQAMTKNVQFSLVIQTGLTLCDPMACSMQGFPVHHQLPELTQTHVHRVGDSNNLIICRPLLLLPSIFPSIRVFSNESVLYIRWPKYWSSSFTISPSVNIQD